MPFLSQYWEHDLAVLYCYIAVIAILKIGALQCNTVSYLVDIMLLLWGSYCNLHKHSITVKSNCIYSPMNLDFDFPKL